MARARDPIAALREQATTCTACDLYKRATQTVFGAGPVSADALFIVTVTVHPSAVLRARDDDERKAAYAGFRDDLAQAFTWLEELHG